MKQGKATTGHRAYKGARKREGKKGGGKGMIVEEVREEKRGREN